MVGRRKGLRTLSRSKNLGLTLAEVVLALGIIAIVALSILGVFTKLMVSATKNTDLTTADALALTIMENAVTQCTPEAQSPPPNSSTNSREKK